MYKSYLFAILSSLILLSSGANAQEYVFKVLGTKGTNQVDGNTIKVGTQIKQGQTISVGEGAYLGLVHHSKKTLEIKKSGAYKVGDLEKQVNTGSSDLAGKYAQFILEELTADESQSSRYRQRVKTGSVTRGSEEGQLVQVMMPGPETQNNSIISSKLTIRWYLAEQSGLDENEVSYRFVVTNMFGSTILEKEVNEPKITLDFSEPALKNNKLVEYQIFVVGDEGKGASSAKYGLRKSRNESEILQEISTLPNDSTAISKLILAKFFESKSLFANAINAYEEALSMSDLEQYRQLYDSFLYRNSLSLEARKEDKQE